MTVITIQQLSASGRPFREFTLYPEPGQVEARLDRIRLAYNMARTRVLVDGQYAEGAPEGTEASPRRSRRSRHTGDPRADRSA